MKAKIQLITLLLATVFMISTGIIKQNSNWPQFRGPENNMVLAGDFVETWKDDLNIKWTAQLTGTGWSSPIVSGEKIFITSAFLEKEAPVKAAQTQPAPPQNPPTGGNANPQAPPPPPANDSSFMEEIWRWEVACFDAKSGKELWKQTARKGSPRIKKHVGATYADETPVTNGKVVIACFGMTGIYCYNTEGKLLWEKDLGAYATLNNWGTGSSPVLFENWLFMQVDNEENSFIVALDATTGEEKWKVSRNEKTTYATPVIWKNKVRTELVTTGKTARAYDPTTGKELWQLQMAGDMSVPSPVYDDMHIYVGNAGARGAKGSLYAVKAGAEGNITPPDSGFVSSGVTWSTRDGGPSNPSPLLHNGLIYLLSGRGGEITCIEASTGTQVYTNKIEKVGACWATPWVCNGKIYFYDEKGITQIFQAGKDFKVLGQNALNDKFWPSIAVIGNNYIFKGVEKLYCVGK